MRDIFSSSRNGTIMNSAGAGARGCHCAAAPQRTCWLRQQAHPRHSHGEHAFLLTLSILRSEEEKEEEEEERRKREEARRMKRGGGEAGEEEEPLTGQLSGRNVGGARPESSPTDIASFPKRVLVQGGPAELSSHTTFHAPRLFLQPRPALSPAVLHPCSVDAPPRALTVPSSASVGRLFSS